MTTMKTIRPTLAADINKHHEQAMQRAGEAVDSARLAGTLLLEAKAAVKHGEWLGWLQTNVNVSARQAQRYIAVAEGKTVPMRDLAAPVKNDIVSHLVGEVDAPRNMPCEPETPPTFLPESTHCYAVLTEAGDLFAVEPSASHPGFFFVSRAHAGGDTFDATRRPVAQMWVESNLQFYGLTNPAGAAWREHPSAGVKTALETFDGAPA